MHPSRLVGPLLLALFEAGAGGEAGAQELRASPPGAQITVELLRSKDTMLRRLLSDWPVLHRIEVSTNAEAKALLARAQEQAAAATSAMSAGDLSRADTAFNEAMAAVAKARKLVPDADKQQFELTARYDALAQGTTTLRSSYARHAAAARAANADSDLAHIDRLISEAKDHRGAGRVAEAIRTLEVAERDLMTGINRVLGSTTLDYAQRFDSPADEFTHELARNRSFDELVPLALNELKPGNEARLLVERYVVQNRQLRDQAQQKANSQDYAEALKALRNGTGYLQRALLAAGLVVPQQEANKE